MESYTLMNKHYILNILLLLCSVTALTAKPNVQRYRVKHTPISTRIKKEITPKTDSNIVNNEQITTPAAEDSDTEKITINPWRLAAKVAVGGAVSLYAHRLLEYIAVYVHENGHGVAGGDPNYTTEVIPSGNLLAPWNGVCRGGVSSFFSIAAGPLAGLCARYLQCIAIETLDGYMHGKSLKESAQQGLRHPFLFFSQAHQTAKKYCVYALNKKTDKQISEPTWSSAITHSLLFLTCGSMIGEFIYGLTPYNMQYQGVNGDGERLWKMVFGDNCPTFNCGNLPAFVLGMMIGQYATGALEAWRLKDTEKETENSAAQ